MEPCSIDGVEWYGGMWEDRTVFIYYFYIVCFFGFLSEKNHSNQLVDSYNHVSQSGLLLVKAEDSIT